MTNPAGSSPNLGLVLPNGAIQGLNVTRASNTTLGVSAGACIDSTNLKNMVLSSAATLNAAVNGLNGLDTGSLAASTWYYLFLIGDSMGVNPTGLILSTSPTAPIMPTVIRGAYDMQRLIGYELTDGSSHFLARDVVGNGNYRTCMWDASISVLAGGSATSLTAIDLSAAVPPVDLTPVILDVEFIPATANDGVSFAPYGSTATVIPHVTGSVAAKKNTGQPKIVSKLNSSLPKILYINSAASGSTTVWVHGFEFQI